MNNKVELQKLVEHFDANIDFYKDTKKAYNEHSCRIEFIDPFLKILGWDVANEKGAAPQYREVIAENYSSRSDRPDYTMTLRGVAKFFVEAKKPSVDITKVDAPAIQTRKYGWNAKHRLAVLTNFEFLAIYDTCHFPLENDSCTVARYRLYHYSEYVKKLDEICGLISKSTVYPNSFSFVANCSAKSDVRDRIVSKAQLLAYLSTQKSVLLNRWTLAAMDQEKVLKDKKKYLSGYFAGNTDIRAFIFSDEFLEANKDNILPFLIEYLNKYFKKPRLHRQPIFIFGNNNSTLQQSVLLGLYQYQKPVNYGTIGECFSEDSFVNNTTCPPNFTCKITLEKNISANLLERCQVNQLYVIGKMEDRFNSPNYFVETLDVKNVNALRYLVGLSRKLEV